MKLYLDPGHGGSDPGAVGNGLKEKEVVLDLAKIIVRLLRAYPKAQVKLSRSRDETKSLKARTREANVWGADLYLSLHCNAFNGEVRGYEDYVYHRLPQQAKAATYRNILHKQLVTASGLPDRGEKKANFHVLRETTMPAILMENGFIDHPEDAKLLKQDLWREKIAQAYVEALSEIFSLIKWDQTVQHGQYAVVAGSFQNKSNAENRKAYLARIHDDAALERTTINGKTMYRVISGMFSTRKEAENRVKQLSSNGIEAFIIKRGNT